MLGKRLTAGTPQSVHSRGTGKGSSTTGSPSAPHNNRRLLLAKKVSENLVAKLNAFAQRHGKQLGQLAESAAQEVEDLVLHRGAISEKEIHEIEARYRRSLQPSAPSPDQPRPAAAQNENIQVVVAANYPATTRSTAAAATGALPTSSRSGAPTAASAALAQYSELDGEDEWAALARMQDSEGNRVKAEEARRLQARKQATRMNLDEQLGEKEARRQQRKLEAERERRELEAENARLAEEAEAKNAKRRAEMAREREIREAQIREAREAREAEKSRHRAEDSETLKKINEDLRRQREADMAKKARMQGEWKATVEANEENDRARAARREAEKEENRRLAAQAAEVQMVNEQRRQADLERKLAKQQHIMGTVGQTLINDFKQKAKEDEERASRFQAEVEQRARDDERARQEALERKKRGTNAELARQLAEKEKAKKLAEEEARRAQMELRELAEQEAKKKADEREKLKKQRAEYQSVLNQQVVEHQHHSKVQNQKMSTAEAQMNRALFNKAHGRQ